MNKEFFEMQEDAVRRVREMQRKARETVNSPLISNTASPTKKTETKNKSISGLFDFKNYKGSQEDFLILSLIILLADEGADKILVLALLYLLI